MKIKFYLLPLLLFHCIGAGAQVCSGLTINCAVSESRCVATGSITMNVGGGSGNYNYQALGPISTPITSSNSITGLPPGYYSVVVKDLTAGCTKQKDSVYVPGSYSDPRFALTKTDASCANNDGTISVSTQQFGRSPFIYTILPPSPSGAGTTNSTGNFSGLAPGEYHIRLQDSCGGIQVRTITIENYSWWFDSVSVARFACDSAAVFIRLKDNKGNSNLSGSAFNGFRYAVVFTPGDTTWRTTNSFNINIGTRRHISIAVKDNCGNIHAYEWFIADTDKPSLSAAAFTNLACSTFTASVTGQNLTNPQYCLYNSLTSALVGCNTTGVFSNTTYGSYCIQMSDGCYDTTIVRCFTLAHPLPSVATAVQVTNKACSTFTATITGQQNLFNASYCLYDAGNTLIVCNATGIFNNLPYGSYCISTHDACTDSTIMRCFTAVKPVASLSGYTISGTSCTSFNVSINGNNLVNPVYCLYDSLGNVVSCNSTGIFNGINNGSYCARAISCGDTTSAVCFTSAAPAPALGAGVLATNLACNTFTAAVYGQTNMTNPQYCLYNANDSLLRCSTVGTFDSLAYGSYCIKVHDGCVDTTILRCFSQARQMPSVNGTLQVLNSNCSTVSFLASGTYLTAPRYCLYNSLDTLLYCNTTGRFDSLPYGRYCVVVDDNCVDTSFRVCQTFSPVKGISITTTKSCTIGNANVSVLFTNANAPYDVKVYHPNGTLVYSASGNSNPASMQLPGLPGSTSYKIIGTDNCGNKDTAFVVPDANLVTKSVSVRAKCPSASWANGAGDIVANCNSNFYAIIPQIIKKNGLAFVSGFSSVSGTSYTFADLEPAQYIVEYTQQTCNTRLYDTVTVPPYAYPSQGQSAVYQCDNNSFSLGADVQGGVSPYSFQIIGSIPSSPSIVSATQSSPIFNINNGTIYSLIRLRTIDACGNATLSDVSVLPLQNISVQPSANCFFQNVTLTVDTVPNASYYWYKRTGPSDSALLDSGLSYNLPFFLPEEAGVYICKMIVNNGCLTRVSSFNLDGNCGYTVLQSGLQLKGRKQGPYNQLYWSYVNDEEILQYVIERKRPGENSFTAIGSLPNGGGTHYLFDDRNAGKGNTQYRLKLMLVSKQAYSNIVNLRTEEEAIQVYPNPVKDVLNISISSEKPARYRLELIGPGGQTVYSTEIMNSGRTVVHYKRSRTQPPGMYLLKLIHLDEGSLDIRKIMME